MDILLSGVIMPMQQKQSEFKQRPWTFRSLQKLWEGPIMLDTEIKF